MSAALYNRYRPATFAQVVGQGHVTDALRKALSTGRLHHAYLFSGPRGCGKTSSARILAASLNCVHGPTPEPCGVCDECVGIRTGSSMDVTEIDAASHGLVDDARDLRERAFFAPASARFKVFVVDEAHMVTAAAFNALLKVVEEPPPYLKFVFATTEPDKVLATIRSRTHHYAFRLVPPGVLREHLASICEREGVPVDPSVLPLVVRAGAGSVRDSLSVLDQLLAGADDDGLHYDRAVTLLGMTDGVLLDETVEALAKQDGAGLFTVVDKVVSAGHDPRRFALDLLDRFRDLIVMAAVPDAADRGLLESFSPDQVDRMRIQAASVGPAELSRTADVLHAGLVEMRGTTSPRLMLELILARALLPAAASDPAALLTRLERLERRSAVDGPAPATPAFSPAPPGPRHPAGAAPPAGPIGGSPAGWAPSGDTPGAQAPARGVAPGPAGGGERIDAAGLRMLWEEVLALAARRSRKTHAILKDHASVADVRGDEVVLAFASTPMGRMFGQGNNAEVFCAALAERVGGTWRVTVAPAGGSAPGRGGRPGGSSPPPLPSAPPPGGDWGSPQPHPGPPSGGGMAPSATTYGDARPAAPPSPSGPGQVTRSGWNQNTGQSHEFGQRDGAVQVVDRVAPAGRPDEGSTVPAGTIPASTVPAARSAVPTGVDTAPRVDGKGVRTTDEPSLDDEDAPQQMDGARGGEEAAMSLLRTGLGATIIEQNPAT
ncbi:DNA polymerase III subunit gamma/tau [Frankia sp. AiPs1]|uniref:DNA polymerase III subunit gamma and tau n=1 Tax=Frankia sp. AiPa1 TaxID=573492 RepID=UPI00202B5CFC|nr:DNA polymerase III subunit gamma and tau [Frankia sp. AiPa1]MCL9759772.1 DNA polymerase III subunit gamma and tau [Frankia sp. AiPa1]